MKKILLIAFALISITANAQTEKDFLELTDGDTLWGEILDIQDFNIRFKEEKSNRVALVTKGLVKSYSQNGTLIFPGAQMQADVFDMQLAEKKLHFAGKNLVQSSNVFYAGVGISLIGILATVTGAVLGNDQSTNNDKLARSFTYVGVGATGVGTIITATAFVPIKQSGLALQEIRFTKNPDGN